MSVPKSKRGESCVQFMETARELEIYTLTRCIKWPKRYTNIFTQNVIGHALAVFDGCKAANSVFLKDVAAYEERRRLLMKANNSLQCLISQLGIAKDLFPEVKATVWVEWFRLANAEAKLIAGVRRADLEQSKKFAK